ncbi:MAG TPA: biopolymer transporter ExbD [Polyangia bacterium]|nr:biopolymer transporter ExbD [Polyangia bacterium]
MGVSVESQGRGRRKEVNAELLLVPYIDLLTCMVAFLLITAVWTQLARLQVQQRGQGEAGGVDATPQLKMAVMVHSNGFVIVVDQNQQPLPEAHGDYDYNTLTSELKKLKAAHPDKTDLQILSEDAIRFDILVKTMDAAMSSGFPDLSLLDAGGAI